MRTEAHQGKMDMGIGVDLVGEEALEEEGSEVEDSEEEGVGDECATDGLIDLARRSAWCSLHGERET